ncbi:MAG: hypothetical protein MJ240_09205 [Kiritimatiellae bacterium]|nr:hypothetical protein [Kiritimatiellia bacterium]
MIRREIVGDLPKNAKPSGGLCGLRLWMLVTACALSLGGVWAADPWHPYVFDTVRRTAVVDGVIAPEEYSVSVEGTFLITGADRLKNFLASPELQSRGYWAWDADNLYVAMETPIRDGALRARQKGRDAPLWEDDSIEIAISMEKMKTSRVFQFIFNAKGELYDRMLLDKKWNSEGVVSRSSTTSTRWTFEAAIPWRTLGLAAADGTSVFVNLSRTFIAKEEYAAPTFTSFARGGYTACDTMPIIRLKDNAPRYFIGSFGDPATGQADVTFDVWAPETAAYSLATAAVGGPDARLDHKQARELAGGKRETFAVKAKTPRSGTFYHFFRDRDFKTIASVGAAYHDKMPLVFRKFRTDRDRQILYFLTENFVPKAGPSIRAELRDWDTGSNVVAVLTAPAEVGSGPKEQGMDIAAVPPGDYQVHFSFLDEQGKVFFSDHEYWTKAEAHDAWTGTTAGDEDEVPSPWTRPDFRTDGFSCWNREIAFGGEGLVTSIRCGGEEALAAPITLVLDGRPLKFDVQLVKRGVSFADYRFAAREADVSVELKAEFDGALWFTVDYRGKVNSLELVQPVCRKHVVGFDNTSVDLLEHPLVDKLGPSWTSNPAKNPSYWFGDATLGLMGGVTDLHGWHLKDKAAGFRFAQDEKVFCARIVFVDTPFVSEGRRLGFYLEPTPTRPKNTELAATPEERICLWTGSVGKFFEDKLPPYTCPRLTRPFQTRVERGTRVFWYNATAGASTKSPRWGWYGSRWTFFPDCTGCIQEVPPKNREDRDRGYWTVGCLRDRNFFDFKVWSLERFLQDPFYAPYVNDLYFDLTYPYACRNLTHACVWKDEFGDELHDWSTRESREYHKRMYRMLKRKNPAGATIGHVKQTRTPADVFFDRLAMGEGYEEPVRIKRGSDYYDVFNPDAMLTQFAFRSGEQIVSVLPQLYRCRVIWDPAAAKKYDTTTAANDQAIRHFMAYLLVHDLIPANANAHNDGRQMTDLTHEVQALGEKRVFRGYYHDDVPVAVNEPNVRFLYGVYAGQDGKGLLVVLNDTDAPVTKTLSFSPTAFGLSGTAAKDLFTQERIDFSGGKATITLPPRESRFFRF